MRLKESGTQFKELGIVTWDFPRKVHCTVRLQVYRKMQNYGTDFDVSMYDVLCSEIAESCHNLFGSIRTHIIRTHI